ncbi:hypothetical protein M3Y99_00302000 [Aphelenchoides fujianensis]|nr:hypothetical protein M3Y99_00302000 [Aphelenchoides fujianensis]
MSQVNVSPNSPLHDAANDRWAEFYSHRPQLLPLKTAMRSNASSTSSFRSDFRTPRTPVRFADPLTEVFGPQSAGFFPADARAGGPRICSELSVGAKNSVKQVDYRVPDRSRPLEVRVANRSLWIDPKAAKEFSPQISAFLLREYTAGHRSAVEPKLDLNYDDVLEAVRACCPTEMGLFATPVTAKTFSTLARMSRQFQVEKLKQACELFVARVPLKADEMSAAFAAGMLNDAFKYGLSLRSKVRLLQGVVGLHESERRDPTTKAPVHDAKNVDILPVINNLIEAAIEEHKLGRLGHSELLNEARLKIPCRVCRSECNSGSFSPTEAVLQVCNRCRHTTCRQCASLPCASLVEEFMEKFAKDYAGN